MHGMEGIARFLISVGLVLLVVGGIFWLISRFGGSGCFRLPGDILIKKDNFTFYFPITTFLLLSIILTVLTNLFLRR